MKPKHLSITILVLFSLFHFAYSQSENCKVLKPEIATSYSGECKKGLANGNGIAIGTDKYLGKFKNGLPQGIGSYQFANGDVYEGDFKSGMKDGNGKFTFKYLGKDSTFQGIWKDDKLIKKIVPVAYVINQKNNIQGYAIQNVGSGNRIMFAFKQNGWYNSSVTNLSFAEDGGTAITIGQEQGFDNVQFPFNCRVTYTTLNSLRTANIDVVFDIQINEPGMWKITLTN